MALGSAELEEMSTSETSYKFVNNSSYTVQVYTDGGDFSLASGKYVYKSGNVWFNEIYYTPSDKVKGTLSGSYTYIFTNN